jgi:hypothetical protein
VALNKDNMMSVMPNIYDDLENDKERSALLISRIGEEISNYRIAVEKDKKSQSAKKLNLKVLDGEGKEVTISRKLTDLHWLRDKLQMDFPYSYVFKI